MEHVEGYREHGESLQLEPVPMLEDTFRKNDDKPEVNASNAVGGGGNGGDGSPEGVENPPSKVY